ncbi:MAG: biopolymer transporter ExbD [Acidobacteriia bacterium]|nr:biopolymer transporter ExbD [Terriglobia bacterium]
MSMAVGTNVGPKSDINITPYIDILLVLLIIFMVITPTKQLDLEVKVPQPPPQSDKPVPPPPGVIVVSMSETAQLAINQETVTFGELGPKLLEIYSARANKNMFISASAKLPYGDVVKIIDIAKGAGVIDVGLLTSEEVR